MKRLHDTEQRGDENGWHRLLFRVPAVVVNLYHLSIVWASLLNSSSDTTVKYRIQAVAFKKDKSRGIEAGHTLVWLAINMPKAVNILTAHL